MESLNVASEVSILQPSSEKQHTSPPNDAEKLPPEKGQDLTPLPYGLRDKFIEVFVPSICAICLPMVSIAILVICIREFFYYDAPSTRDVLIPKAFQYNKGLYPLPDGTKLGYADSMSNLFVTAVFGLYACLGAVAWAMIVIFVPRDKLLRAPPLQTLNIAMKCGMVICSISIATYAHLTYQERDAAHGSGCFTSINRRGRHKSKCYLESASCYIDDWPDLPRNVTLAAGSICREARAARYLTLVSAFCVAAICGAYDRSRRLQVRLTTEAQRKESEIAQEKSWNEISKKKGESKVFGVRWEDFMFWGRVITVINALWGMYRWYMGDE